MLVILFVFVYSGKRSALLQLRISYADISDDKLQYQLLCLMQLAFK
jgi:hypothetical protein